MQANCTVCKADVSGATALSSSAATKDLYGTHRLGLFGKVHLWKSVSWLFSVYEFLFLMAAGEILCNIFHVRLLFFKCWRSRWAQSPSARQGAFIFTFFSSCLFFMVHTQHYRGMEYRDSIIKKLLR